MTATIRGFAFPFRIDPDSGSVAAQAGDDKLRENIAHILLTGVGERIMRRGYGGGLQQLVHDPNNEVLRGVVQHQVAKSLGRLEPRIILQEVRVVQDGETLLLRIKYIVRSTRQVQTFSVPFGTGVL
ncbi:Gene 25-like lysozyme [Nannocystis exedens]|uniref:Gene 25-like lysozyme n=1 Tax=Nannocystis exedens TaxID=54 RepID=A0A1I2FX92_9BACT|nr:GPW/gp25 family protein [Nannocystis exedens]PCC73774.1 putative lysozyme [Nannocystis exedens]SFF09310.1 Gene 25-like lysozyme [Nannocystis exedens]